MTSCLSVVYHCWLVVSFWLLWPGKLKPFKRLPRSGQSNLHMIKSYLTGMGYAVRVERVRSDNYGLPQRRVRLLFFGIKDNRMFAETQESILERVGDRMVLLRRPLAPVEAWLAGVRCQAFQTIDSIDT